MTIIAHSSAFCDHYIGVLYELLYDLPYDIGGLGLYLLGKLKILVSLRSPLQGNALMNLPSKLARSHSHTFRGQDSHPSEIVYLLQLSLPAQSFPANAIV